MPYDPLAAPPSRPPKSTLAEYSSICPVCHIYIARNWSEIVRLPEGLPVHCRDRNGKPAFDCDDYTRSGYRRSHRIIESAWVHARCYGVGLKIIAAYNIGADILGNDPTHKQVQEQASKEIDTLLLSARTPGSTAWGNQEDWAADHD